MPRDQDLTRSNTEKPGDRKASERRLRDRVDQVHGAVLGTLPGVPGDAATRGRRHILDRHAPGPVYGRWVSCDGPHGREGGEYGWPCDDYRDAAGDAAELLPAES